MKRIAICLIALLLGFGSYLPLTCRAEDAQDQEKAARPSYVIKPGVPADHGLKPEDIEAIKALLKKPVDDAVITGDSLLIAHKGEVIFREGFGKIMPDDSVRLASSTKPIAATGVMLLVDAGKLSLDDPISKFIPEFKGTKVENSTIRQLLSHTSGILGTYPGGRPTAGTMADFARLIAKEGSFSPPGTFSYSGVGIDIAGCCAEIAAGMPVEAYLRANLLEPLGMMHTTFTLGADASTVPKEAADRGEGRYISCGGGMSSTLDDVAAFYLMHLNGGTYGDKRILSGKAITEMHSRQSVNPAKSLDPYGGDEYGLGFYRDRITKDGEALNISHGGALGTFPWVDLDRELVCVFFAQTRLPVLKPHIAELQKKTRSLFPSERDKDVVKQASDNPGPELVEGDKAGAGNLNKVFKKISKGADTITKEQFGDFFKERFGDRARPKMVDRIFSRLDANQDGALTLEEFGKLADILKALKGVRPGKKAGPEDIDGEE
ncbi:MAG: serine hydrolase [Candidatus Brocadiia bacterium]